MGLRSIKDQLAYMEHRRKNPDGCGFCDAIHTKSDQYVTEYGGMAILRNKFPYVTWDAQKVTDHRMVIPHRHIDSMQQLTDQERTDLIHLIAQYEADGYSFYIRSKHNGSRTMTHIHGHLIKTS